MSYSSKDRNRVKVYYENHQPVQQESRNQHGEVRYAWQESSSPRGNTGGDANSSFERSQQRSGHRTAATEDMETEENRDKSNEEVSLKTTAELFTALESLPELVEQSKRELRVIYQSAPTRVTRENAELKKNLEQVTKENQNLKSTSSTNQGDQVNKLKDDFANAKQEAEKYKNAYFEIKGRFKETLDSTKALRDAAQKDSEKNEELGESLRQLKHDMNALAKENESLKRDLSRSKDNYTRAEDDKKKAESELSQSRTRLSRLMGNKLSDNNPDIADLSDKNRPTKIAEKYTELYDNEWTDAFEVFQKHYNDDKRTAEALLQILWDVKDQCDKITNDQNQRLREAVALKYISDTSLPEHILKQIKDFRRFIVETSLPEVIVKCSQNMKYIPYASLMKDEHVESFFKSCVELCWLMSAQDPPLAFGETPHNMDMFDADTYKHYTATGQYFAYLVWPALRLEVAGPLLCKGVAQACGGQPNRTRSHRVQRNADFPKGDAEIQKTYKPVQFAPSGQDIDRHSSESGNFAEPQKQDYSNTSSRSHGTDHNVHGYNYDQSVVGSANNHAAKLKNFSQTIQERRSPSSTTKNINFGYSHRESSRTVVKPRQDVWFKFIHLKRIYGIDSQVTKTGVGEDYMACRDYYNYKYSEESKV